MLYLFYVGKTPFKGKTEEETLDNIRKLNYSWDIEKKNETENNKIPKEAKDLIQKILIKDPKQRIGYGSKDYKEIKEHPWFNIEKNPMYKGIDLTVETFPYDEKLIDYVMKKYLSKDKDISKNNFILMIQYHACNEYTTTYYLVEKYFKKHKKYKSEKNNDFIQNLNAPEICIPALIGREILRYEDKMNIEKIKEVKNKYAQRKLIHQMIKERHLKDIMIGDEVIGFRSLLDLSHPVSEGIITNEEDLYRLWDYTLTQKLGIEDPSDKKILVTEAPYNPISNKFKIFETLFEKIGVAAVNIEPQAKCSLFSEGIDTGIVLDSGDGVTHCIPVSNGAILNHTIERMDIAGRHITEYLVRLLQKKGYAFNSSADFDFARELKEKYCFISNDIESDRKLERQTTFYNTYHLLPDETRIRISDEKFEAPEILFNPSLIEKEYDGIPMMMMKSINKCPIDCRKGLYNAIVLSGANTLFPGFASRVENEIKAIYKKTALKLAKEKRIKININVLSNPKRKYSVFIGASVVAKHYSNNDMDNYWITRDEWLECENISNKESLIKTKCESYIKDK